MSIYYCPFCSSRYQFNKTNIDNVLICGQCGEPLIKKSLINFRQLFGLLGVLAFLAPLMIMIFFVFEDFSKEKEQYHLESSLISLLSN